MGRPARWRRSAASTTARPPWVSRSRRWRSPRLLIVPQPSTAATGIRARRQPKPARKLATAPEGVNVTDGTDQGGRRQLPDTGDRLQLPTDRVGGGQVPELAVDLGDAVLQGPDLLRHAAEHAPQRSRQLRGGIQQRRNLQHRRLRAARRILSSPSASGHDAWSRRRATARHGSDDHGGLEQRRRSAAPAVRPGLACSELAGQEKRTTGPCPGRPCAGATRQENSCWPPATGTPRPLPAFARPGATRKPPSRRRRAEPSPSSGAHTARCGDRLPHTGRRTPSGPGRPPDPNRLVGRREHQQCLRLEKGADRLSDSKATRASRPHN